MLALGGISALILGAIYGCSIFYIPFIYLSFIITLGFGGIVGFLVGLGGKYGNIRNLTALALSGFIVGIFAEYIGWVSWMFALSDQQYLVLSPFELFVEAKKIANIGAWSIFDIIAKGNSLYVIWAAEAVMIIGMSTIVARSVLSTTPFCEPCSKWIEKEDCFQSIEPINAPKLLRAQLEQGNFTRLTSLKIKESVGGDFTEASIKHCTSCEKSCFLTVKAMYIDSANTENINEHIIVENLIISDNSYRAIKETW